MPGGRPSGYVQPDLTDYLQCRVAVHSVDPGQVDSGHPVEVAPHVEVRRVLLCFRPVGLAARRFAIAAILKPFHLRLDFPVALGYLALVHPVQLQSLGQLEDVLVPPVSLQRSGYGRLVRPDPGVSQPGKPLAGGAGRLSQQAEEDGAAVGKGRKLGHVADSLGKGDGGGPASKQARKPLRGLKARVV